MKYENYQDYTIAEMASAEIALLTAWESLKAFADDLVLIGGLAIHYLTKRPTAGMQGAVTTDVDFAIQLGTSSGIYPSLQDTLSAHGFRWQNQRFHKPVENFDLYIDLVTDDGKSDRGTVMIDNGLAVSVLPGIQRALDCYRVVEVSGTNMIGVKVKQQVHVADIGPMLVLKLNAFGGPTGRKAGKDVHDILYLATQCDAGPRAAVTAFQNEIKEENRGIKGALECLRNDFNEPDSSGPMACAAFRLNNEHRHPSQQDEALRIRQQCVTLASELLRNTS